MSHAYIPKVVTVSAERPDDEPAIRAMGINVLVKEVPSTQMEAAGGLLQIELNEPQMMCSGFVRSIGHKVNTRAIDIEVGQRVWFRRECGTEIGHGLLMLKQDFLAVECPSDLQSLGHWYDDRARK